MNFAVNKFVKKLRKIPHLQYVVMISLIFGLGIGTGYAIFGKNNVNLNITQTQKDPYVAFLEETYDKIKENYWDSISDEQLTNLYKLAAEKITGRTQKLDTRTKPAPQPAQTQPQQTATGLSLDLQGTSIADIKVLSKPSPNPIADQKQALEKMIKNILKDLDNTKKIEFSKTLAAAVLTNLSPLGRSGLYTQKQEEQLKNTVSNINPGKDLYKDLGLSKGAAKDMVEKAYQEQSVKLAEDKSDQAKQKLKDIAYARSVLTQDNQKKNYDSNKVEPTVFNKIYPNQIAYIKFLKFSPTTYDEFTRLITSFDTPDGPKALIFDLRNNVGGAIDSLPFFLGNFLGDKQEAYEFLHKGEYEPFKTIGQKLPGLIRLKQIIILIDKGTQSSAELLASALKKYHFGVVVGEASKGWGTVEKVFPITNQIDPTEKLSLFLVHSITIRDDGQPIEGRGVEPDISITDPDWEGKLFDYFRNPDLIQAIKTL